MNLKKNITSQKRQQQQTKAKWDKEERHAWRDRQTIQRSYFELVVNRIQSKAIQFNVTQYGSLNYSNKEYPLLAIQNRQQNSNNPLILITGGVHGYETSGVMGALSFVDNFALKYSSEFNFLVAPCVSPWGFESINRWNPDAIDPNRSFHDHGQSNEANALMAMVAQLAQKPLAHFDLHETTDTDNSVFRPALAARDGIEQKQWDIPDGFYLVADNDNPVDEFQAAIVKSVEQVTHIAEPDKQDCLIGEPISQHGVINYAAKKLGLCIGFSKSEFATTTEVYPDSPHVTAHECINAQVAAITGGLDYLASR